MYFKPLTTLLCGLLLDMTTALPAPKVVNHKDTTSSTSSTSIAPTHTAPSTCQTYYPTILRQLVEAEPDIMQVNTANTTKSFHVSQSISFADNVKFDRIHQHVVFDNINPGSWDCQLMVSWPDSKNGDMNVTSSSHIGTAATSGVSIDVYSAYYNASAYKSLKPPKGTKIGTPNSDNGPFTTWDGMMRTMTMKGNNGLSEKGDNSKDQDKSTLGIDTKLTYFGTVAVNPGEYGVTINSEACASSTTGDGDGKTLEFLFEIPSFDSRNASVSFFAEKEKGSGVYLLANC